MWQRGQHNEWLPPRKGAAKSAAGRRCMCPRLCVCVWVRMCMCGWMCVCVCSYNTCTLGVHVSGIDCLGGDSNNLSSCEAKRAQMSRHYGVLKAATATTTATATVAATVASLAGNGPKNVSMHVTLGCNLQFDFLPRAAGNKVPLVRLHKFMDPIDSHSRMCFPVCVGVNCKCISSALSVSLSLCLCVFLFLLCCCCWRCVSCAVASLHCYTWPIRIAITHLSVLSLRVRLAVMMT